jgi:hypothetical protein
LVVAIVTHLVTRFWRLLHATALTLLWRAGADQAWDSLAWHVDERRGVGADTDRAALRSGNWVRVELAMIVKLRGCT